MALVLRVRKHLPEIQYLTTSIFDEPCSELSQFVGSTIDPIESVKFLSFSDMRFPMIGCTDCTRLASS